MCCFHVCVQLSQLTRPAAMFVFPAQVSSPSSLFLQLSYEAEGQRNERQGSEAHSDLWYEISSLSTVGNFHICAHDFSFFFFFSYQRRTWTAKQRMRSRWWRRWDLLLLAPPRWERTMIALYCAATRRCSELRIIWLLPSAIKLMVNNVFSLNMNDAFQRQRLSQIAGSSP